MTLGTTIGGASLLALMMAAAVGCGDAEPANGDAQRTNAAPSAGTARATPPDIRSAGGYRIVGTPFAGVTTTGNGLREAAVTVRTNKALPRRDGSVAATIRLDGHTGVSPPIRVGDKKRRCYVQPVEQYPRPKKTGDPTALTVTIPGVARRLRMRLTFVDNATIRRRTKSLCGSGRILDEPDTGY